MTDVSEGSPDYFAIKTGLVSVLPPIEGTAVVQKNLSLQERQEVALGIFMSIEESVEDAHLSIELLTSQLPFGPITRSGYSIEDLPSNLVGFYVAWMTDEIIDEEQLKDIVSPICHVLDEEDSLDVFDAYNEHGWQYAKNTEWRPYEIPESLCSDDIHEVLGEKCGDIDRSWPEEFSWISSEPPQENGKWWWWNAWRGPTLYPSDVEGVYLYDAQPPPSIWSSPVGPF